MMPSSARDHAAWVSAFRIVLARSCQIAAASGDGGKLSSGGNLLECNKSTTIHRQLATTRNIAGGGLRSLLSGGLNHHIEHHLFPAMPAQQLTRASRITRSFCRRHGLAYREHSWRQGIAEVLGQIRRMGRMARELRQNIAVPAWQDQA